MRWAIATMCGAVVLAGCSSARLDETVDCPGGQGVRGGVVSYRYSREQGTARQMIAEYCNPKGYRIVNLTKGPAGEACRNSLDTEETSVTVGRTYLRFECEQE